MNEETNQHRILKDKAKEILRGMGFQENEIFEEFSIIPDVVGMKTDRTVAIECGNLSREDKLNLLGALYDEVIHLPFTEKMTFTTIRIFLEDKARLEALGTKTHSFAEIIKETLDELERLKKKMEETTPFSSSGLID